ncbi:MAG TPA: TraB/GumN family protein, partial [Algoriphagus sp.]|nr:TraB/GumN family protein [Algoriphagus sp.]
MKQLPCDQMESYEFFFTQMAQQQGKEILGLEDVAFQVGIFDQIPLNVQLEELGKMVTTDESMKEFQTMVEAYVDQDL